MFVLQLLSSALWVTLGVMTKQWFMLLAASNNIVQTICILYVRSSQQGHQSTEKQFRRRRLNKHDTKKTCNTMIKRGGGKHQSV